MTTVTRQAGGDAGLSLQSGSREGLCLSQSVSVASNSTIPLSENSPWRTTPAVARICLVQTHFLALCSRTSHWVSGTAITILTSCGWGRVIVTDTCKTPWTETGASSTLGDYQQQLIIWYLNGGVSWETYRGQQWDVKKMRGDKKLNTNWQPYIVSNASSAPAI